MIKWLAKRYVIGVLNDMLDQYKDDVDKVKDTLKLWVSRLEKILGCFKGLLEKLEDNKIDDEEVDQTVAEIELIITEW